MNEWNQMLFFEKMKMFDLFKNLDELKEYKGDYLDEPTGFQELNENKKEELKKLII